MRAKIIWSALLFICFQATATTIGLAGVSLEIPTPAGYAAVDPATMKPLADFLEVFVPKTNTQFLTLLPAEQIEIARGGGTPDGNHRLVVQTLKAAIGVTVSQAEFDTAKTQTRTSLVSMIKQFTPEVLAQINQRLKGDYDLKTDVSLPDLVAFPPHEETTHSIAFSMQSRVQAKGADGVVRKGFATFTGDIILVRGKLLYLYCYGGEKDLVETRETCSKWSRSVIEANLDAV